MAVIICSSFSSDRSETETPSRFSSMKCLKKSMCSWVRSNCNRQARFLILPSDVISSTTYMRFPVGITSTFEITEYFGAKLETTVAHLVIWESAVVALCRIRSSVSWLSSPSISSSRSRSSWGSVPSALISSIYMRYPLKVGTRPAEVCGCSRYPSSSNTAMSFRTVAADT